jgi:hypothetical protein
MLLTAGVALLGLAALLWWDGSHWGKVGAYLATVLAVFPLSWGVLLCWHQQAWAGFVAAALASFGGLMIVPWVVDPGMWQVCLLIAGLSLATATGGIRIGRRRLRQSAGG